MYIRRERIWVNYIIDDATPTDVYFTPKYPFDMYTRGHLTIRCVPGNDHYKIIVFARKNQPFRSIPLSRYMVCVNRGADLTESERLAFKDNNPFNCNINNIYITTIPGSWNIPIQENPEDGSRFKPEPPFNQYQMGYVQEEKFFGHKRRVVKLFNSGQRKRLEMKCARYMKIVDHFKKTGEHIKDPDKHVHHINENPMDDRYDNLEWQDAKLHHRYHLNQILQRKVIKPALCCPVCMTLFEKEVFVEPGSVPHCCSLVCYAELTKRYPIKTNEDFMKKLALKQRVLVKTDANFLNFDLAQLLKDNGIAPLV